MPINLGPCSKSHGRKCAHCQAPETSFLCSTQVATVPLNLPTLGIPGLAVQKSDCLEEVGGDGHGMAGVTGNHLPLGSRENARHSPGAGRGAGAAGLFTGIRRMKTPF